MQQSAKRMHLCCLVSDINALISHYLHRSVSLSLYTSSLCSSTLTHSQTALTQIMTSRNTTSSRFYRALYDTLLSKELRNSSKHALFFNLLIKAIKFDSSHKRMCAFVKRLLQVCMYVCMYVCIRLCDFPVWLCGEYTLSHTHTHLHLHDALTLSFCLFLSFSLSLSQTHSIGIAQQLCLHSSAAFACAALHHLSLLIQEKSSLPSLLRARACVSSSTLSFMQSDEDEHFTDVDVDENADEDVDHTHQVHDNSSSNKNKNNNNNNL